MTRSEINATIERFEGLERRFELPAYLSFTPGEWAAKGRASVPGGITSAILPDYAEAGADAVIAGGGTAHAPDPAAQAERLAGMAHSREANR